MPKIEQNIRSVKYEKLLALEFIVFGIAALFDFCLLSYLQYIDEGQVLWFGLFVLLPIFSTLDLIFVWYFAFKFDLYYSRPHTYYAILPRVRSMRKHKVEFWAVNGLQVLITLVLFVIIILDLFA